MAKLTGQFTTPSFDASNNKIHKAFLHGVVFVFTGATKVTRESDDKGKYDFDLAAGEYEVSVYLKGSAEKDRFDMRAGEKFTVTASTPVDALEKWLQIIGDNGKDEVATYYENLLAQMQKVSNDFKDETQAVGSGKFMKEGAYGIGGRSVLVQGSGLKIKDVLGNKSGTFINNANDPCAVQNGAGMMFYHYQHFITYFSIQFNDVKNIQASIERDTGVYSVRLYNTGNTIVDSNGNLKAASPVLRLFNDRIETNDQFVEDPVFKKIEPGTYKISNTLGLAQEGWTYEKPRGSDGQPYFRIVVEKLDDGCIVTVHDEYDDYERVEIMDIDGNKRTVTKQTKVLSAPRDIKEHERWIDLRFHEEPQEHHEEELLAEY